MLAVVRLVPDRLAATEELGALLRNVLLSVIRHEGAVELGKLALAMLMGRTSVTIGG